MITSVKQFGSYLRQEYKEPEEDVPQPFDSSCTIPAAHIELKLLSKKHINHDCAVFKFALPTGSDELRLPVGAHLLVTATIAGRDSTRPYTSLSIDPTPGTFELLVKRYDEWGTPEVASNNFLFTKTDHSYRPPGAMSTHIHSLSVGDTLKFKHTRNCLGKLSFPFTGVSSITMLAVGIGVAPMINIITAFTTLQVGLTSSRVF